MEYSPNIEFMGGGVSVWIALLPAENILAGDKSAIWKFHQGHLPIGTLPKEPGFLWSGDLRRRSNSCCIETCFHFIYFLEI